MVYGEETSSEITLRNPSGGHSHLLCALDTLPHPIFNCHFSFDKDNLQAIQALKGVQYFNYILK